MHRRLTEEQVEQWWGGGSDYGVAVVCGEVSQNVEMLELESGAMDSESLAKVSRQCRAFGIGGLWDELTLAGYAEVTPTGGLHLIYRLSDGIVPGNTKLAQRPDPESGILKTLAETRGEGGYVIVAPTSGPCHPNGESWSAVAGREGAVPFITMSQRNLLHRAITMALDETPVREVVLASVPTAPREGVRPGDDFNERGSWADILLPHGWMVSHVLGRTTFWTRPGKDPRDGHSATTGYSPTGDRMYCFSSSAGLPTEEPMSKLYVYAQLNHGGDMTAAARQLGRDGYGDPVSRQDVIMEASVTKELVVDSPGREVDLAGKVPPKVDLFDRTESDVGNAERLEAKIKGKYAFDHVAQRWMEFNGIKWEYTDTEIITELAREVAEDIIDEGERMLAEATTELERKVALKHRKHGQTAQGVGHIRAMIWLAARTKATAVTPDMFDHDKGKVNAGNGLIDLDYIELAAHDPEQRMTMKLGADYKPEATAPRFVKLMEDLFPDEDVRDYVQRALGYTLSGASNERAFFLLHGPTGTGKSTLMRIMTQVFGDYGHVAAEDTFQVSQGMTTTSLHELRKRRFVCTSELPRDAGMNENLLKRITGGDPITSRTLYQRGVTWQPQCTLFVATNFLPRISGDDDALWRRAKVIEMTQQFGVPGRPENKHLAEEIYVQEASGILNWLLDGLRAYRERGLEEPEGVRGAAETYRAEADPVAAFLAESVEDGALRKRVGASMPVSMFYAQYEDFCRRNRYQAMGIRRVNTRMRSLGYESIKHGGRRVWQDLETSMIDRFILGS
jgi:putative DNA primase/helicase